MKSKNMLKIGKRPIGENNPVYIIAEIGLNHQGDIKLAKKLINIAKESGADCVKFQKRSLKKVYKKDVLSNPEKQERGLEYSLGHIQKAELSKKEMRELFKHSEDKGIDFMCTPWDEESLLFLENLGVKAYKIASADMFNLKLLEKTAALKKPMFVSTGMSFVSEIEQVAGFLNKLKAKYALLHANSTYPAPHQDINLRFLKTMNEKFGCVVGYSGHERGISTSIAAVALGAKIIEKHLTLDKTMPGPDHRASLEPKEFADLVREIRITEKALGQPARYPSRGEYLNREILSKSLVAARNIKHGEILKYEDIDIKSPGMGTNPLKIKHFIGKKVISRDIKKDDYLLESDVKLSWPKTEKNFSLKHKWGIVVRMSDIDQLIHWGPDFVEVHLSDADVNTDKIPAKKYNVNLVVHGPEYNGDLLLDLSNMDEIIRKKSIDFFNKSLVHARKLKPLFNNRDENVKFVVHPGGTSMNAPLLDTIPELNINLHDSLKELNAEGFDLLVENMPGLPWFFGGQWYHASFMNADELVDFSKKTGYGIVFDVSHAALYCNYYNQSLEEFTKKIISVAKHVHISDAAGSNGEGLQIGDGTVDFKMILKYLVKTDLWFLPEIWQGHRFGGERFIKAIKKLKEINSDF